MHFRDILILIWNAVALSFSNSDTLQAPKEEKLIDSVEERGLDLINVDRAVAPQLNMTSVKSNDIEESALSAVSGQPFDIALDANKSTGYSWQMVGKPEGVEIVGSDYLHPEGRPDKPMVGVGGRQVWHVRASRPGTYRFTFRYKRPWNEDSESDKLHNVIVEVHDVASS